MKAAQWKAAIDFKWIRDNEDAVAANIKSRNSNANLQLVLELYDKLLSVQKVRLQCFWNRFCILCFAALIFLSFFFRWV